MGLTRTLLETLAEKATPTDKATSEEQTKEETPKGPIAIEKKVEVTATPLNAEDGKPKGKKPIIDFNALAERGYAKKENEEPKTEDYENMWNSATDDVKSKFAEFLKQNKN